MEQLANAITFWAHYIATKVGKTGLTVTVDVWELTQTGTATEIVTAGSATEVGDGLYRYVLAAGSVDAVGDYIAVFKTADATVDQQHIAHAISVGRAGIEALDATVIATAVRDVALAGSTGGTAGGALQLLTTTPIVTRASRLSDATATVFAGDSLQFLVQILDIDGDPIDLAGATAIYALFASAYATTALVEKDSTVPADNLNLLVDGIVEVNLDPADTVNLDGTYYHEIKVTTADDETVTGLAANLVVQPTVLPLPVEP